MLAHAYEVLLREKHEEIAAFDHRSDPMSRLTWLRARASRVFDQIETIYLTHHFHGHAKFLGFTIPNGDGRDFQWTDSVAGTLHESIGNILALDDEAKASCELIHFDMEDGDDANKRRLHYLVVYHPGKMRLLRQMKNRKRDLFSYIPALEATLVYDPAANKVHVLSDRKKTAEQLAQLFSQVGFDKPLSKQPVDAVTYELSMFKQFVDLKAAKVSDAIIDDAWVSSLSMSLGHSRHSVSLDLAASNNIWFIANQHFGEHNPIATCRSIEEARLSFVVRFDDEKESRALDITIGQRGSCNLFTMVDPRLRRCGEDILTSLGVMHRVKPAEMGSDMALFLAELTLLDFAHEEVDGHLLSELQLPTDELINKGLLKKKLPGQHITLSVDDENGLQGFRRLAVQSNSTSTWAEDDLTGQRYQLTEGDLCRFDINKPFLWEQLAQFVQRQLSDTPLNLENAEPFHLGVYAFGNQSLPVTLVSKLTEPRHADKMDTEFRKANLGFSIVLTTTAEPHRRYLGSGLVVPIQSIVIEENNKISLDFTRIEGEIRFRQNAARSVDIPHLIKIDSHNALLTGPWPEPWTLTKKPWIDVVELLVEAWTSGLKKCTKLQMENAIDQTIRGIPEFFRGAPEWNTYIRGADGNNRPRYWELNIGLPELKTSAKIKQEPDA